VLQVIKDYRARQTLGSPTVSLLSRWHLLEIVN
jgi:hypothetical protein